MRLGEMIVERKLEAKEHETREMRELEAKEHLSSEEKARGELGRQIQTWIRRTITKPSSNFQGGREYRYFACRL